jgi:CHAD domain-containing protein
MSKLSTPFTLFDNQLQAVRTCLPGVREGDADSIHDARIATRRIRELLRFARAPIVDEWRDRFRTMGRALGRVRDVDVSMDLLAALESRLPSVAPALVSLRHDQRGDRLRLVRDLIKRFERLGVDGFVGDLIAHTRRSGRSLVQGAGPGVWRHALQKLIVARGQSAREALEHSTGVYFPNRMHAARIALKKLRYTLEVAHAVGAARVDSALRELKKSQQVLGDLHDRQELVNEISKLGANDSHAALKVAQQLVDAEIDDFHKRYLRRRSQLVDVARQSEHIRLNHGTWWPSMALAGAVAVSSGAYMAQRRLAGSA